LPISILGMFFNFRLTRRNQWSPRERVRKKAARVALKQSISSRESIKDLSGREKKRVKGGGGAAGGVVMSRNLGSNL